MELRILLFHQSGGPAAPNHVIYLPRLIRRQGHELGDALDAREGWPPPVDGRLPVSAVGASVLPGDAKRARHPPRNQSKWLHSWDSTVHPIHDEEEIAA